MDTKNFVNNASTHLKKYQKGYGLTIILILLLVAILVIIRTIKNNSFVSDESSPSFLVQSTQALLFTATPTVLSTPTLVLVSTPSNLWTVKNILGKQTINGFTSLIIEFENTTSKELKKGQCQQPGWEAPEIGHIYTLNNTFSDYWLFIPIEGIESELQRFALIL